LQARVCLACYLPHAPKAPADWVPYRAPKPPKPPARDVALRRIYAALESVASVVYSDTGITGTCPLCRSIVRAHVGRSVTVLECEAGCAEAAIWRELKL
jgi:hypothetical protein